MPPRPWCRLYHSTHRSPDLREQPYGVRLAWYVSLELATIADRSGALGLRFDGQTPEQRFAKLAHLRCNLAQEALGYFVSCRMMRRTSSDYIIVGWDNYQRKSDVSNERVTLHREQPDRYGNVTVSASRARARAGVEQSRADKTREEKSEDLRDRDSVEPVDNPTDPNAPERAMSCFADKIGRVLTADEHRTIRRLVACYGEDAVTATLARSVESSADNHMAWTTSVLGEEMAR